MVFWLIYAFVGSTLMPKNCKSNEPKQDDGQDGVRSNAVVPESLKSTVTRSESDTSTGFEMESC